MLHTIVSEPKTLDVFSGLKDIEDCERYSRKLDSDCFLEIAKVFDMFECTDRFCINLLHTHFPVYEDEVMIERVNSKQTEQLVFPIKRSDFLDSELIPTSWRLTKGDTNWYQPTQFACAHSNTLTAIPKFVDSDVQVFRKVRSILDKFGKLNKFGIGFSYQSINVLASEIALEATDLKHRILATQSISKKDDERSQNVPTNWILRLKKVPDIKQGCAEEVDRECITSCNQKCKDVSKDYGGWHDTSHSNYHTDRVNRTSEHRRTGWF